MLLQHLLVTPALPNKAPPPWGTGFIRESFTPTHSKVNRDLCQWVSTAWKEHDTCSSHLSQALGRSSILTVCTLCFYAVSDTCSVQSPLSPQFLLLWVFIARCQHRLPTKSVHSDTTVQLSNSFRRWSPVACSSTVHSKAWDTQLFLPAVLCQPKLILPFIFLIKTRSLCSCDII